LSLNYQNKLLDNQLSVNDKKEKLLEEKQTNSNQQNTKTERNLNPLSPREKLLKSVQGFWNFVKDPGMLWRLGFHSRSHIDVILEREDCTVEDLLEEDDILQEARAHNQKLTDFLIKQENVKKLIEYITVEIPPELEEEDLKNRIHKYPHLACEIICSDIEPLYDVLTKEENLKDIFSFISTTQHNNLYLVQYWIKVVSFLLQRRPIEVMKFIRSQKDIVKHLVNHVGIGDMQELLLKFMGCEAIEESDSPFVSSFSLTSQLKLRMFEMTQKKSEKNEKFINENSQWWLNADVISLLMDRLDPNLDSEVHQSITFILAEILTRSTKPGFKLETMSPLANDLLSQEKVDYFISKLLKYPQTSILLEGIPLLSVIINASYSMMALQKTTELPPGVKVIVSRIKDFTSLLSNPPKIEQIETSFGVLDPPLGEMRLRIIEFLVQLFKINCTPIEEELLKCNVLQVITNLVFTYEFNNLLHNYFISLVNFILNGESIPIKKALFRDCNLLERIIEAFKENERVIKQPKGMRKGYIGHFISISNHIVSCAKLQPVIEELVSECKEWNDFVNNTLTQRNIIENRQLGGPIPSSHDVLHHFDESLDDDDFDDEQYRYDDDDFSDSDEEDDTLVVNPKYKEEFKEEFKEEDSDSSDDDDDDIVIHSKSDQIKSEQPQIDSNHSKSDEEEPKNEEQSKSEERLKNEEQSKNEEQLEEQFKSEEETKIETQNGTEEKVSTDNSKEEIKSDLPQEKQVVDPKFSSFNFWKLDLVLEDFNIEDLE